MKEAKSKDQRLAEIQRKALSFKKSLQYLNLFIKGHDKTTTTEDDFKSFFKDFGIAIKNIKVNPNGFAFVSFLDRDSAKKAKDFASNTPLNGHKLEVSYFEPKEIRSLHMEEVIDKRSYQQQKQRELYNNSLGEIQNYVEPLGKFLTLLFASSDQQQYQ